MPNNHGAIISSAADQAEREEDEDAGDHVFVDVLLQLRALVPGTTVVHHRLRVVACLVVDNCERLYRGPLLFRRGRGGSNLRRSGHGLPEKLLICNNILQFFVDFVDFNIILSDKIQAICRWLVFYPKNYVKINKINKKL